MSYLKVSPFTVIEPKLVESIFGFMVHLLN